MKLTLAALAVGIAVPSCAGAGIYVTAVAPLDEVAAAYPPKARELGVEGIVRLACSGPADGPLTKCRVASESPSELGFGAAAMELLPHLALQAGGIWDGRPDDHVSVSIRFKLPSATGNAP